MLAIASLALAPGALADAAGLVLVRPERVVDEAGTGSPPLPSGQDGDGFPDTDETVDLSVLLANKSGGALTGVTVRLWSTDPKVDCIANPIQSLGAVPAGATVAAPAPFRFRVAATADRGGASPQATCGNGVCSNGAGRCAAAAECARTAADAYAGRFRATVTAAELPAGGETDTFDVELDLDAAAPALATSTFADGFEAGLANFTLQSLDTGIASNALSDGKRCQYSDPDFVNSNSYGSDECFLGFVAGQPVANDWHLHGTAMPDGGRAYRGSRSLHNGVHTAGNAALDTLGWSQMDTILSTGVFRLAARVCRDDPSADPRACSSAADCVASGGGPCVAATPELAFEHQISTNDSRCNSVQEGEAIVGGVVQAQVFGSPRWEKVAPYANVYDVQGSDDFSSCLFDPTDDGNDEDSYFEPSDPNRRLGPSSTCYPEFVFSYLGDTDEPFAVTAVGRASDGPGLPGSLGPGTWVESRFDLARFRGRSVRLRWLFTSIQYGDIRTPEDAFHWNPVPCDDGWYVDDVRVSQTLGIGASTASLDPADRSSLPGCAVACGGVTAALSLTPSSGPAPGGGASTVALSAAASTAGGCPGGQLVHEFRVDADGNGAIHDPADWAIAEESFSPYAAGTAPLRTTGYGVRVRCASEPACGDEVVIPFVVHCPPPAAYSPDAWWTSLRFDGPDHSSTHAAGQVMDVVRGRLSALRTAGSFGAESCHRDNWPYPATYDPERPPSGDGFYYLIRGSEAWCAETPTFRTYHPAENPGDPAKRDREITACPGP